MKSFIPIAISYALLYFGNSWYYSALNKGTDTLNGIVLIFVGAILLLRMIYLNFKNTNFTIGFFGTIFQLSVYSVLTVFSIFALLILFAYASQTRPVYSINSRD